VSRWECDCGFKAQAKWELARHVRARHAEPERAPEPAPLPLAPDAPFLTWRRKEPEEVASCVEELGLDPCAALAYELTHDKRPGLIAALEEMIA
jgi:hypothetical protein